MLSSQYPQPSTLCEGRTSMNDPSPLYDLLNRGNAFDLDFRKLSLSSESSGNDAGFSGFLQESAKAGGNTASIQVRVPTSEHVAEIVGKQGCKIKTLRYSTRTYIQTPAREQEPVFTISGYPDDVDRAKRRIEEAADHFTKIRQGRENNPVAPNLGPNAVVKHVRVPLKYVGLVVGPKGHNIKRIQSETDTYIVTPAREKEPIFEIRGAPEKVSEAESKLQMYIAMRTGGLFDDPDHFVDVDLKKPMVPPKPLEAFSSVPASLCSSKSWSGTATASTTPKPEMYGFGGSFNNTSPLPQQVNSNLFDLSRIEVDSGYSSPNFDNRKDLQALKLVIDQIQQTMSTQANTNIMQSSPQQYYPSRWSHSGTF